MSKNPVLDPGYLWTGEDAEPEVVEEIVEAVEPPPSDPPSDQTASGEGSGSGSGEGSGEGEDEPPSADVRDYHQGGGMYLVDGQRVKGKAAAQAIIDARPKA